MPRMAVIWLEDARLLAEVLRNEKIVEEYDMDTLAEIARIRDELDKTVRREDMRARVFGEKEALG